MKQVRYYQNEAKEAIHKALGKFIKKMLLLMPGGTGKSFTAVNAVKDMGRKLWISHEESLLEQSAIALLSELDLMPYGELVCTIEEKGGLIKLLKNSKNNTGNAKLISDNVGMVKSDVFIIDKPIVMASAQTLHSRLSLIPKNWFKVIVADECDLFFSRTFRAPLDYFEYDLLLGLTATNFRADGVEMTDIFDITVYEYTIEQAIKDGYLTELNGIVVRTSVDLDDVGSIAGDFNTKELTSKVNTLVRNNLIVNKYLEYCEGQQFICFGSDIQHVIDLHETFREHGVETAYVVSDKDKMEEGSERFQIVKEYKSGRLMGLVNHNIFSAGFDAPNTGCVILACPTKSKRKFLQQLYRVTRLKDDDFVKRFGQVGTILDIVDQTKKHKLINTHELDKGKPIEDRLFLSVENRKLLIESREERERLVTENVRAADKVTRLIPLPLPVTVNHYIMRGEASEAQLAWLKRIGGYDIENYTFTKGQASQIIKGQPANKTDIKYLEDLGYDSTAATIGHVDAVKIIEYKKQFKKVKK